MNTNQTLSTHRILNTWWPLAASWLLMAAELPAMSIVVARLADPKINLAAFGSVVFPVALIIESPIIMLLSASTTLSKDWASYIKIRHFMMIASAILTALHALVAFTPLYYLIVVNILGAPAEVIGPARIGLMVTTPWTWAIAYRRFNQGVLIRFGHSKVITIGTLIRLITDIIVLAIGYAIAVIPGAIVASAAIACGVVSEAIYVGIMIKPVLKNELKNAAPVTDPLTLRSFLHFYLPLAMTSLLILFTPLIVSATLSRMPQSLDSLAVWPVMIGLISMFRGLGMAYNEVVVALLDEPGAWFNLRRFMIFLVVGTSGLLLLMIFTPFAKWWFISVIAINPVLAQMALWGLWFTIPLPAFSALQSWFQGAILHSRHTRAITESVAIYLLIFVILACSGVAWGGVPGFYVGLTILSFSTMIQTAWLWWRSRPILQKIRTRDEKAAVSA